MTSADRTQDRADAQLAGLASAATSHARDRIEHFLEVARDGLEMDIAYFSEFTSTHQVIRGVRGDSESFGFGPGTEIPLEETYCKRMLAGHIPNVVPDTTQDPELSGLPATADSSVGAYVGVPIQLSAGRVYGTLCSASRTTKHSLDERDARFLRVLARLLADEIELTQRPGAAPAPTATGETEAVARLTLWFAGASRAAPAARHALASLHEHLDEAKRHDLDLCVTELVTNSVRHAGIGPAQSVGLEVTVGRDRVYCVVSDPGPGFDPADVPPPDEFGIGGRGLMIVDHICARWGVDRSGGTHVWFELDLSG